MSIAVPPKKGPDRPQFRVFKNKTITPGKSPVVDTHSPKYVLQHDPSKLTRYECNEILKFDTIYYYG